MTDVELAQLLFAEVGRGIGVGVLVISLALALDRRLPAQLRWAILLFSLSGLNNALGDGPMELIFPPAEHPLAWRLSFLAGSGHAGLLWALWLSLFDDRTRGARLFAPAAGLIGLTFLGMLVAPVSRTAGQALQVFIQFAEVGLMLHAVGLMVWTARGDLVETRRRLRWMLLIASAGYAALFGLASLARRYGEVEMPWMGAFNMAMNAGLLLAFAALLLQLRTDLLAPRAVATEEGATPAAQAALERLESLMREGEAWRREGLTVAALARETGTSERQLRRLINGRLGHRNFAAFVAAYRIEAAKAELARPDAAAVGIADLAFSLGYTSLGPFNRAFKQAVGQTPSAYRRHALAGDPT